MSILLAMLLAAVPQEPELFENEDPGVRRNAIEIAGARGSAAPENIVPLIARLENDGETESNKAKALEALEKITGRREKDAAAWRTWWESEGFAKYAGPGAAADRGLSAKQEEAMTKAKQDIRAITTVLAVSIFLFIIVMFFFVGHVSSKIKGWRELVARAEVYVKHGQELTERTDKIAAELESRKAEVSAFLEKIRKEQEEIISRRGEELGSELAHEMRMELQTLRQKAERELDQTVTDLKTQLETTARRAASEVRDRLAK